MLCTYLYNTGSRQLRVLEASEMMDAAPAAGESNGENRCREGEFLWVDITAPTAADFELLQQRFGLHPMVLEDIDGREGRPKLHVYPDYLYLIFHAINLGPQLESGVPIDLQIHEIDCLVGVDWVITIHATPLGPLDDLRDRWLRRPEMMQLGPRYLLYEIMDEVLDDYFPLLDTIDDRIDRFEERLFIEMPDAIRNNALSGDIFTLKRCLIQMRRIAGPTRDVVNTLLRHDADSGGKHFIYYQDLYDHVTRIVDMIDNFRDILGGALDAYLASESNRMNSVMKTLTAASIILLVPNLIAAIYGMNFDDLPKNHGFYGSLLAMVSVIVGLALFFKHKRWI